MDIVGDELFEKSEFWSLHPIQAVTITSTFGFARGHMVNFDWDTALKELREHVPEVQFQHWVKPLTLLRSDENCITFGVPNRFHQEWVQSNFSIQLSKVIQKQTGVQLELEFEVDVQEQNEEAAKSKPTPTAPTEIKPALRVIEGQGETASTTTKPVEEPQSPKEPESKVPDLVLPEFNTPFWELDSNRVAYRCGLMIGRPDALPMNPLIIYGGIGMGKTHLLSEIARRARRENPRLRIRYVTAESFTDEYVRGYQNNQINLFKKKYREETDLLLFDDLQGLTKRIRTQEQLVHCFNDILTRGGQVVFGSSVGIHQLKEFTAPLKSRLLSGVIAEINEPDFEERVRLLENVAILHKLNIDNSLLRTLASKGQKDNRELVGSLIRIHLQSRLENVKLDHHFLSEKGMVQEPQGKNITLDEILSLVEQSYSVTREELVSKSRKSLINWARQVAMYLARSYTLLPLEKIGQVFDRDHATVIHAFDKVSKCIKNHHKNRYQVEFLMQKLSARTGGKTLIPS